MSARFMIPLCSFFVARECSRIDPEGKDWEGKDWEGKVGAFEAGPPRAYIQGMSSSPPPGADAAIFDAELKPHRSLSPRGFLLLMLGIGAISFAAGLAFFLAGAWPVIGFLGADVLLIYLAFKANYRSGRMVERLHLTRDKLTVSRIWPSGRQKSWEFQPTWLQVVCDAPAGERQSPDSPADCPLILRSHGHSLSVGSFLTRQERRELADALRAALNRAAQPCRPV
jgi:uncharacterized membrane protein